ncbi:MAG: MaoC family dehydratase N-terminal domain-containing protein [Chloroflexi bacterium]|nr:MaoC family dehydratase N-terminal domain-containing protein [Chloroflexota bacterium]
MEGQVTFSFNRAVLGKEYDGGTYTVTRQAIRNYVEAICETNPLYTGQGPEPRGPCPDVIAPPPLLITFIDDWEPPDLDLKFDGTLYLAGYWIEPLEPVRPGDELRATIRVVDVYPKTGRSGPMVFLVKEAVFTDQRGRQVARVGSSSVWRK